MIKKYEIFTMYLAQCHNVGIRLETFNTVAVDEARRGDVHDQVEGRLVLSILLQMEFRSTSTVK